MLRMCALFCILLFQALAMAENGLGSLEDFRSRVAGGWKYECANRELLRVDSAIASKAAVEIPRILFEGLKRIQALNPSLVGAGLGKVAGKKLTFKCIEDQEAFLSRSSEYSRGTIKLSVTWVSFLKVPVQIYGRTFD